MTLAVLSMIKQQKESASEEIKSDAKDDKQGGIVVDDDDEEEGGLFAAMDGGSDNRGGDDVDIEQVRGELVTNLISNSKHEDAADLLSDASHPETYDLVKAVECYVKANNWNKAIKFCIEDPSQTEKIQSLIRPTLLVAVDLKSNQIKQTLDTFGKRYLRLKIVQHTKKNQAGLTTFGGQRDFELDSDALSMSAASQSAASASGRSSS
jgi:hypothetical protein